MRLYKIENAAYTSDFFPPQVKYPLERTLYYSLVSSLSTWNLFLVALYVSYMRGPMFPTKGGDWTKLSVRSRGGFWFFQFTLPVPSGPDLFTTIVFNLSEVYEGHAFIYRYAHRGPEVSNDLPKSQSVSWALSWKGGRESGLAKDLSLPSGLLGYWPMAEAEHLEKGNSSLDCQAQCRVHRPPLSHRSTCVFVERPHRVGFYAASRSGLHGPCSPSQIIEPRPHSAGRNLEIASAGASEPPGQLMKADSWASVPRLWLSRSGVALKICFSSKLPKHVSAASIQAPHVSNTGLWCLKIGQQMFS